MTIEERFRHRRRIALVSFALLCATILGLLFAGIARPSIVATINDLRWLVTTATGLWSTLILGYYVAASYEQGRMRNDEP